MKPRRNLRNSESMSSYHNHQHQQQQQQQQQQQSPRYDRNSVGEMTKGARDRGDRGDEIIRGGSKVTGLPLEMSNQFVIVTSDLFTLLHRSSLSPSAANLLCVCACVRVCVCACVCVCVC